MRLGRIQSALNSPDTFEALSAVRQLIPDDGQRAQQTVVYGYATILEVNSAGLSILFDRFDQDERQMIQSTLEVIGAARTLAAFRELETMLSTAVANGVDSLEATEWLEDQPQTRRFDRDSGSFVNEMEQKLLEFCKAHLDELAGRD